MATLANTATKDQIIEVVSNTGKTIPEQQYQVIKPYTKSEGGSPAAADVITIAPVDNLDDLIEISSLVEIKIVG